MFVSALLLLGSRPWRREAQDGAPVMFVKNIRRLGHVDPEHSQWNAHPPRLVRPADDDNAFPDLEIRGLVNKLVARCSTHAKHSHAATESAANLEPRANINLGQYKQLGIPTANHSSASA